MRTLHVIPYLHPSAGGPPVVVENFVRESNGLGHSSEIVSMPLFCKDDEAQWLRHFNKLAPTTFGARSRVVSPLRRSTRQRLSDAIYNSDIVHVHTIWN